jgi:hypothetical protein
MPRIHGPKYPKIGMRLDDLSLAIRTKLFVHNEAAVWLKEQVQAIENGRGV